MKKIVALLLFMATASCLAQDVAKMVDQLKNADFGKVYSVKDDLVSYQEKSIPLLIALLKDTSFVKLKNTADLIYPGAEEFYGHGWVVGYDIDWISVRAAWLLEEITFQNFGYLTKISEDDLMALHRENYAQYLKTGAHNINLKNPTPRQDLVSYRLLLAAKAENWWNENKTNWSRFAALKEALSSSDETRQSLAIQYLRDQKTKCDGCSPEKYESELKPLVVKIKNSNSPQAGQAKYLLDEN
jgi:hypothetical protein